MATLRWRGDIPAVAQVDTVEITGYDTATTYKLTINGKVVSVIGQGGTTTTTAAALVTAWNDSVIPEFAEITASSASNVITLTADTKGVPNTVTSSVTGGTGTIGAVTSSTAVTGPNFWNKAANWSTGATPVAGDDVYIDSGESILYGLSNAGATLTSLNIAQTFTGTIGLPYINEDGTTDYIEYRDTYLAIDATTVNIGYGVGNGSGRIKLNQGTIQTTWNIFNSGNTEDVGLGAIILKGTHASNALNVVKGDLDAAPFAGETATILTLNVGYLDNQAGDSDVYLSSGVTLTNATIKVSGGRLETNSALGGTGTLVQTGGTVVLNGTGTQTGLSIRGGECQYNTTGTLGGNPVVSNTGHLDFSRDLRTKAVTNPVEVYGPDAKLSDPHKVITTLVVDMNETARLENISIGTNVRITRGTPA